MGKKKEKMGRFYLKDTRNRQITADKREIENFLKLPSATSFIRKTLSAIVRKNLVKNILIVVKIIIVPSIVGIFVLASANEAFGSNGDSTLIATYWPYILGAGAVVSVGVRVWKLIRLGAARQKKIINAIHIVRVITTPDCEQLDKRIVTPVLKIARSVIGLAGFKVVGENASDYDATLRLGIHSEVLGAYYTDGKYHYSGAKVSGVIDFISNKGKILYSRRISKEKLPPHQVHDDRFTFYTYEGDTDIKHAPFVYGESDIVRDILYILGRIGRIDSVIKVSKAKGPWYSTGGRIREDAKEVLELRKIRAKTKQEKR